MPTVTQQLQTLLQSGSGSKPKIGMDTNCVQYYLAGVKPWADCLDPIFQAGSNGDAELYISTVVASEILAHAHFDARTNSGSDPELSLMATLRRNFKDILAVNEDIAKASGRLRASYIPGGKLSLKTPDVLIGATSVANAHSLLITNDYQLMQAISGISCIYLKDVALEWLEQTFLPACMVDPTPVVATKVSSGLSSGVSLASELCSIKPEATAQWGCILTDAFVTAAALNEPCLFLLLIQNSASTSEIQEVLLWHDGLTTARPISRTIKHLKEFMEWNRDRSTGSISVNPDKEIYAFCFTSLNRETIRQTQPNFNSRSVHQKQTAIWNNYLTPFWHFRDLLNLPQITWMLCEDGVARKLDSTVTLTFLDQAKNVLGWKEER
ncbi:MAG: type II toxin-antitoxin system VapC family toxin [Lyngbya sp. HA4199-MV5]|jgi:predicted nucleic acid-binding protein|nr:type II toxin-antitoxin system VapC family toxin [Lyngbya sp. HA4199-MV5]